VDELVLGVFGAFVFDDLVSDEPLPFELLPEPPEPDLPSELPEFPEPLELPVSDLVSDELDEESELPSLPDFESLEPAGTVVRFEPLRLSFL
jgi:hypothetical protein